MNLAQMKQALESSVAEALKQSINKDVEVKTSYDANNAVMIAELIERKQIQENSNSILCYNIRYAEETGLVSIIAFNRVLVTDVLGVSLVNNEAVVITNKFMNDIAQIIAVGIDRVYHPEHYQTQEMNVVSQPVENLDPDKVAE